ncbi:scavenger receptor cysteine-rich type 1 protein M160-like [Channa argus]|uniref:scavenger receptor cysteine-rich type 1 protein M160-like n=1 Tax=Channa argus TaxID=215402 RepID=UPI003521C511
MTCLCSEPDNVRLVRGWSRCDGELQVKQHGRWRKAIDPTSEWNLTTAGPVCRHLDCGSAVWTEKRRDHTDRPAWKIPSACVQSESAIRECVSPKAGKSPDHLEITCTGFLTQPNISFYANTDGVSEATQQGFQVLLGTTFTIRCSILPKYPGGSFQLMLTTSAKSQNYTQTSVNHSAHFLFSAADHTHQGDYRCVFLLFVFSQSFSSQSQTLHLTVSGKSTDTWSLTGTGDNTLNISGRVSSFTASLQM